MKIPKTPVLYVGKMHELEKGRECTHLYFFAVRTQLRQGLESVLRSSNRNETKNKVIRQAQKHFIKSVFGCSCNFGSHDFSPLHVPLSFC